MQRSRKYILLLVLAMVSLAFVVRQAEARSFFSVLQEKVAQIVQILPWHDDPPPEECTCPDHEEMCGGGMHNGDMGNCQEGCPMEMGSCEMMGECHGGGGAPARQGNARK